MSRMVFCKVLKREAEGLDTPPYPGELGTRIFENVSKAGWQEWLKRLTTIINENQLNTADPSNLDVIEQHLKGFIFGEGNLGQLPPGFSPAGSKK
ncbi:MAG: oxidative damage protection protein [Gammaproteobacteria bacterium]|nr:oxidative damage protection protein [Gammaproteobacteria bacterium]